MSNMVRSIITVHNLLLFVMDIIHFCPLLFFNSTYTDCRWMTTTQPLVHSSPAYKYLATPSSISPRTQAGCPGVTNHAPHPHQQFAVAKQGRSVVILQDLGQSLPWNNQTIVSHCPVWTGHSWPMYPSKGLGEGDWSYLPPMIPHPHPSPHHHEGHTKLPFFQLQCGRNATLH